MARNAIRLPLILRNSHWDNPTTEDPILPSRMRVQNGDPLTKEECVMQSKPSRRWVATRFAVLVALFGAFAIVPSRGFEGCEACVWDWNGSEYVASCQESSGGGVSGCIEKDADECWVGDPCEAQ